METIRLTHSSLSAILRSMTKAMLTTPEVAEQLGIGIRRVQALIAAGRLPSTQYGRDHLVKESDLKLVAERKPGRPGKQTVAKRRTAATTKRKQD
ncbi:MAG: helix-turn-helix domain-containing protein [Acidobacteriota bacterium]|nr:helix-turn-helix domain-containing protein [Acidobacteriota bacterium]